MQPIDEYDSNLRSINEADASYSRCTLVLDIEKMSPAI